MARGFKDLKGRFRPTGSKSKSSKLKTTKTDGLAFKTTPKRQKWETESLDFQLGKFLDPDQPVFAKDFDIPPETFLKAVEGDPNWIPAFGKDSIKELKERMEKGEPIDKPFLILLRLEDTEFLNGKAKKIQHDEIAGHQGRHRAFTAKELGIKSIPVEVYCKEDKGITAKCTQVDRKILENAMSQFTPLKEIRKAEKKSDNALKDYKKSLNKLKKKKNLRSDDEVNIFVAGFEIKKGEFAKKIREQSDAQAEKKKKKIKELFND